MAHQIHQFFPVCKLVTHPTTGQLVSGGFTNKISKSSEIPHDVMNAVFESDGFGNYVISKNFNIPDTSPPKDDQVALIARDLRSYCILAVANAQKDDGNRQFVGYRFFWLSKLNLRQELPSDILPASVDGVGTLLLFWQDNQKLSFDISLISHNQKLSSYPLSKPSIRKYFYDHYSEKLRYFSSLTTILSIFESNQDGRELTPEELHYLALEATRRHQRPIAWAWNVRNLSEPQNFTVIYCADKDALQKLSQPKLPPTLPHIIVMGRQPVSASSPDDNTNCLLEVSRNPREKIPDLFKLYETYKQDLYDFRDKRIMTRFQNEKSASQPQDVRYVTLIAALAPDQDPDLESSLLSLNKQQKSEVITFLEELLKSIKSSQEHPVKKVLLEQIGEFHQKIIKTLPKRNESILQDIVYRLSLPIFRKIIFILPTIVTTIFIFSGIISIQNYSRIAQGPTSPVPSSTIVPKTTAIKIPYYLETNKDSLKKDLSNLVQDLTNPSAVQEPGKLAQQKIYASTRKSFVPVLPILVLPISLDSGKKEDIEKFQSAFEPTGFYQGTHYTPGKFTKVDAEAVKKFQRRYYNSQYKTGIDGQVGPKTWNVLSKLFVDKQVEIAAHYLQQSFTIHDKDSDIKQDFKDLQSCKKEGSKNFINCVNEKIDQKHFYPLPNQ